MDAVGGTLRGRGALRWLLLAAWCVACAAPPVSAPRGWLEVRSAHFVFHTDLDRERARSLAVDLERFRAAVLHFTNVERLDAPIPVRIFVFSSDSGFRPFRPELDVAGFVVATPRSYDVAFTGRRLGDYRTTLYHEYVHFLVQNQPTLLYPKWYDEGFAEFLSTVEQDGSRLIVGSANPERAAWLVHAARLPIATLLDSSQFAELGAADRARFYAWSWLLVHYLSMDLQYAPGDAFHLRMQRYIEEVAAGAPETEAFAAAWGFDTDELERRLDALIRDGVARGALSVERLAFEREVSFSPLSTARASRLLGELALHSGKHALARSYFELALAGDPDDPRALAGLGDTWKAEAAWQRAEPLFERAVALAPDDPLTLLDRGEFWLDRAASDPEEAAPRAAWLERARADFEAVLAADPERAEALLVLGASHLVPGGDPARAALPLERALAILPRDPLIQTQLMRAYAALGRREDARRIAGQLLVAAHGPAEAQEIERFLAELER